MPDFLTDGAVQANEEAQAGQSPESEVDCLRQEIELYRQQLAEQSRRMEVLQRQLDASRNKEHEYTQNLAKALEQVEESLERSNVSCQRISYYCCYYYDLFSKELGVQKMLLLNYGRK